MIGIPVKSNYNPKTVYQSNFTLINESIDQELTKYINEEICQYYIDELGIEKIVDYLNVQDNFDDSPKKIFQIPYVTYEKNKEVDDDDDEVDEKLRFYKERKNPPQYNMKLINEKIVRYFLTELVNDIPFDTLFCGKEDVKNFIKMYEQKFLYENLIPTSNLKSHIKN